MCESKGRGGGGGGGSGPDPIPLENHNTIGIHRSTDQDLLENYKAVVRSDFSVRPPSADRIYKMELTFINP